MENISKKDKVYQAWSKYDGKKESEENTQEQKEKKQVKCIYVRKWVSLILTRNILAVASAKKAKFEN